MFQAFQDGSSHVVICCCVFTKFFTILGINLALQTHTASFLCFWLSLASDTRLLDRKQLNRVRFSISTRSGNFSHSSQSLMLFLFLDSSLLRLVSISFSLCPAIVWYYQRKLQQIEDSSTVLHCRGLNVQFDFQFVDFRNSVSILVKSILHNVNVTESVITASRVVPTYCATICSCQFLFGNCYGSVTTQVLVDSIANRS